MSERLEAFAELVVMAGDEAAAKALAGTMQRLTEAIEERDRYRRALVQIADSESGRWGWIAHEALHPKGKT